MRGALALALSLGAFAGAAPAAPDGNLTVYAASSLKDVFPAIGGARRFSFAGSDQLAYSIAQGAPADVFASASPTYTQSLYRRGLVERPVTFATNRLVVLLPRSNPAGIVGVGDLARPGVKLVLGEEGVPIGDYARTALARLGLGAALRNVVSNEPDARGIVGKVLLGQADAGIVYATDARPIAARTRTIPMPARAQPRIRYELAVVSRSSHLQAARAYLRRILGPLGRRRLAAAGFGLP